MSSRKSKSSRPQRTSPSQRSAAAQPPRRTAVGQAGSAPELVDPRWLLKALGVVFFVALVCAWGTLCLLWYQGQWQLVLHPSRTVAATPASVGLAFTDLRFGVDNAGQPQFAGWFIPAESANQSTATALVLHGADGTMSDALPSARMLHSAGMNVVMFDYRGYGRSTGRHPSEDSMETDAAAALTWVVSTQHVAPQQIVLYGIGIGGSLAVQLAAAHREIAAIILDGPDGDLIERVAHDPQSKLVPARLLFHENFPLAAPLRTLSTPKLLIAYGSTTQVPAVFASAADPKITVEVPSRNVPEVLTSIERFLDLYVTRASHA